MPKLTAKTRKPDPDKLQVRYVPLATVKKWDRNPKPHDIGKLLESFERYGFKDPMKFEPTLNDAGGIVEGNGRTEVLELMKAEGRKPPRGVAAKNGDWLVPVLFGVDAASRAEAEAYAIDHNALTVLGGDFGPEWPTRLYEEDGLKDVLLDLGKLDELPLAIDGDYLDALMGVEPPPAPEAQIDKAEELLKVWKVERGQVWEVGKHRVMCGDSTVEQDASTLMGGALARVVVTDPPYGVGYDGGTTKRSKLSGDDAPSLYEPALLLIAAFSDEKCPVYLWHSDSKSAAVSAAVSAAGYERRCTIIWNKNQAQFGALGAQYKTKHEPCYYLFKRGMVPRWFGPTNEVTVWNCDRSAANEFHPTQKPPELAIRALQNSSEPDDIVFDPFLGSGTTMVAAEQLGRRCYGMEIEPKYVAVILQRMADMGLEPRLADG